MGEKIVPQVINKILLTRKKLGFTKGKNKRASFLFNENEEILDYTVEEISE